MNNLLSRGLSIFVLLAALCNAKDMVNAGCSASRSEDVFHGLFEIQDLKKIVIVDSNQKGVYPIPIMNEGGESVSFKDHEFFVNFKNAIATPKNRNAKLAKNIDSSFHIFLVFKAGKNACLHGRLTRFGFIVEPMFNGNSFSGKNNELYNVIMLRRNRTS